MVREYGNGSREVHKTGVIIRDQRKHFKYQKAYKVSKHQILGQNWSGNMYIFKMPYILEHCFFKYHR